MNVIQSRIEQGISYSMMEYTLSSLRIDVESVKEARAELERSEEGFVCSDVPIEQAAVLDSRIKSLLETIEKLENLLFKKSEMINWVSGFIDEHKRDELVEWVELASTPPQWPSEQKE